MATARKSGSSSSAKRRSAAAKGGRASAGGGGSSRGGSSRGGSARGGTSRSASARSGSSAKTNPRSRAGASSRGGGGNRGGAKGGGKSRSSKTSPSSARRGSTSAKGGRSGSAANTTTDHDEIRQFVESKGGQPACVRGTGGGGDVGLLRIDFPGFTGEDKLQPISWEEFFEKFDEQNLAMIYQEQTKDGRPSNFVKLVSRDNAKSGRGGSGNSKSGSRNR